jgi:methyl acetate hydrolase
VFWVASMTKMVTTVAALRLRDVGLLDFDAPVASYVPEWDKVLVLDGFHGGTPSLRAPRGTATVANLLTHTAGQGYWFWNQHLVRYERVTGHPMWSAAWRRRCSHPRWPTPATGSSTASAPTGSAG